MKEWYFVFFENEGTYSITCEDFIKGDPKNLVIGGPVDVRHGKRIFTEKLISQGRELNLRFTALYSIVHICMTLQGNICVRLVRKNKLRQDQFCLIL